MDAQAIYALSNELGIAVDKVEEIVTNLIPSCQLKSVTDLIIYVSISLLLLLCLIITLKISNRKAWNSDFFEMLETVSCIAIPFIVIGLFILLMVQVPHVIGWYTTPDVMVMNMLLKG